MQILYLLKIICHFQSCIRLAWKKVIGDEETIFQIELNFKAKNQNIFVVIYKF